MDIDDYERRYEAVYAQFSETIRFILERAISEANGVPRQQSTQCRAKSAKSLRPKLNDRGLLESNSIEREIKDLAGVRLIFYTNTDVDRFLNARLIPQNFDVDWDATKIHHPTEENSGIRYQAIHYTVRLNEGRTKLPEYARFSEMRCEIQIQTVLNHAWSETSHDILYKDKPREGFGTKAMESITNRFKEIMDNFLLPAGYEFQRVQHDYERLQQGKELFDRDAIHSLEAAANNNERHELLTSLKDYALPNYDNVLALYADLRGPLLSAAKSSRASPIVPIKTPFGDLEGRTPAEVTTIIVGIFDTLRYADVSHTFSALCELYEDEPDDKVRQHILDTIKHLVQFDLDVWRQAGPQIQIEIAEAVETLAADRVAVPQPILITVWAELLESGLTGTNWTSDSVTLRSGALPVSDALKAIREKAMSALFGLFERSTSETQKREVLTALQAATHVPPQADYSNELLALTLVDAKRIVDYLTRLVADQSYELLEHLEETFLYEWRRARDIAGAENDRFGCRAPATDLMKSIEAFRDAVNVDQQFVRYKILVGFESVFPQHWHDEQVDFKGVEKYRRERIQEFIDAISEETEEEWYRLIERCAATKSNDMMTFPIFCEFLFQQAKSKPGIATRFLQRANDDVLNFLPAFLGGLSDSDSEEYQRVIPQYLAEGKHLTALVRHFRRANTLSVRSVEETLGKAIRADDDIAVIECLVLAVEKHSAETPLIEPLFIPAIKYLIARRDARWVRGAWFLPAGNVFFAALPVDVADLVLQSLLPLSRIEHQAERILVYVAERHPQNVWTFLRHRLDEKNEDKGERYQAVPFRFHGLATPLALDVGLAVRTVRSWYRTEDRLFQYTGGRLLSAVFPGCPQPFAQQLIGLVEHGAADDIGFVLSVLRNYEGEPATHPVLRAVVDRLPDDDPKLVQVDVSLQNTGVVGGEFGFVEAFRRKKLEIASWLDDPSAKVKAFATKYIRALDLRIASEQRSAEQQREQRKREFDGDGDD